MSMQSPGMESLRARTRQLLPMAIQACKSNRFNQLVYFLGGAKKCDTLTVISQTNWRQVKVALRQDGKLCLVWGWHDYVNVPRPEKPTGVTKQLAWFVRYHAFGFALGPLWRYLPSRRLGMVVYKLDEIVDPLYAGYNFPLWSHVARSGR